VEGAIEMIRRYLSTETVFNHNKYVLSPIKVEVVEVANGMFESETEIMMHVALNKGDIISTPTPRGEQPFRVYRIVKTLAGKKAFAKHIFYDLVNNFLIDIRPTNLTCDQAIKHILSNAETPTSFTGSSDVVGSNTAYYIRKNPVEAIIGADNSLLNLWGGNLVRNGKDIQIKANGNDRGFEIRLGKNLVGIEDDSDESGITTSLYPTVELNQIVYALPEKYVNSPQIGYYPEPIIKEVRVALTTEQQALPLEDIYAIMRTYCNNLYAVDNIDKPVLNYKIDFVQLKKVAGYEKFQLLEQLDLYDLVKVNVETLDISLKAKVISYRYDGLEEKYNQIELGGFKPSAKYQTANIIKQIQNDLVNQKNLIASAIDYATNVITGNKGGYVVFRNHPDGKPYEILVMDQEVIGDAKNVIRINQAGIGFSQSGYNGPFTTAILINGQINADSGFFNSLVTNLIQSDIGSSLNLSSNVAIVGLVEDKAEKTEVTQLADSLTIDIYKAGAELINQDYRSNPSAPIPIDNAELWHVSNFGQLDNTYAITIHDTKFCRGGYIPHVPGNTYYMDNDEWYTNGTGQLLIGLEFWDDIGVSTIENNGCWYFPLDGGALTPNDPAQNICKYVRLRVLTNWGQSTTALTFIKGLSLKRNGQATSIIGTSYRFDGQGFAIKDSNGSTLITPNGMANEQNFGSTQNVEDGYPLNMSFEIGDTTSVITSVKLRLKQYNFRTDSKGAASGGGVKTTPEGGGKTSGASSKSSTDERWTSQNLTGVTVSQENGVVGNTHNHAIGFNQFGHNHGMAHTHTTQDHSHNVDITHGHTVEFGILEYTNGDGTIEVDIDGVRRTGTINTDITLDITPWVTTNGVHTIALRSPNMKRIQCDVFIKSYIRR